MKNVLSVILLMLIAGCSAKPAVAPSLEGSAGKGDNEIYIVSHGWHTGFVVPADDVQRRLPELEKRFGNTAYIEFGWGDEGFYQAEAVTSGLTLKAILWPSESVMHVVAVPVAADEYFSGHEMVRLCLTDGELRSLVDFIEGSFYKDERGEIRRLGDGLYGDSQFYKGVGEYHLMNTCNKWTAKGLRSAGVDIFPAFKLTAGSIMKSIAKIECNTRSVP
ncbi:TIGR02117 family protein [Azotobacter salinestris]|uniref:TIGR02117 family protein n=1 Tax=Azotobacter salinestris TaxID=69964 RepID=UPI0032DF658E